MNAGVGIGLFICLVIIVIVGVASKIDTDNDIGCLNNKVEYLDIFYNGLDKSCGNMYDIIKKQQEEIKELKRMIEQPEEKKSCCGNCRFCYELNSQSLACLNVNVNNKHKVNSIIYEDGKSITFGTIKCVQPKDCCEYYESEEDVPDG